MDRSRNNYSNSMYWDTNQWATPQWREYYDEMYRMEFTPRLITDEQRLFGDKRCVLNPYYDTGNSSQQQQPPATATTAVNTSATENAVNMSNAPDGSPLMTRTTRTSHRTLRQSPQQQHRPQLQQQSVRHMTSSTITANKSDFLPVKTNKILSGPGPVATLEEEIVTTTTALKNDSNLAPPVINSESQAYQLTMAMSNDAPISAATLAQRRAEADRRAYELQQREISLSTDRPAVIIRPKLPLQHQQQRKLTSSRQRRRARTASHMSRANGNNKSRRRGSKIHKRSVKRQKTLQTPRRRSAALSKRRDELKVDRNGGTVRAPAGSSVVRRPNSSAQHRSRRSTNAHHPQQQQQLTRNTTDGSGFQRQQVLQPQVLSKTITKTATTALTNYQPRVSNKKILLNEQNSEVTLYSQRHYAGAPNQLQQQLQELQKQQQQQQKTITSPAHSIFEQPCGIREYTSRTVNLSSSSSIVSDLNKRTRASSIDEDGRKRNNQSSNEVTTEHMTVSKNGKLVKDSVSKRSQNTTVRSGKNNKSTVTSLSEVVVRSRSPSFSSCQNEEITETTTAITTAGVHSDPQTHFEKIDKRWIDRRSLGAIITRKETAENIGETASQSPSAQPSPTQPSTPTTYQISEHRRIGPAPLLKVYDKPSDVLCFPMLLGTCDAATTTATDKNKTKKVASGNTLEPYNTFLSELGRLSSLVRKMADTSIEETKKSRSRQRKTSIKARKSSLKKNPNGDRVVGFTETAAKTVSSVRKGIRHEKSVPRRKVTSSKAKSVVKKRPLVTDKRLATRRRGIKKRAHTRLSAIAGHKSPQTPAGKLRVTRSSRSAAVKAVRKIYKQTGSRTSRKQRQLYDDESDGDER